MHDLLTTTVHLVDVGTLLAAGGLLYYIKYSEENIDIDTTEHIVLLAGRIAAGVIAVLAIRAYFHGWHPNTAIPFAVANVLSVVLVLAALVVVHGNPGTPPDIRMAATILMVVIGLLAPLNVYGMVLLTRDRDTYLKHMNHVAGHGRLMRR